MLEINEIKHVLNFNHINKSISESRQHYSSLGRTELFLDN